MCAKGRCVSDQCALALCGFEAKPGGAILAQTSPALRALVLFEVMCSRVAWSWAFKADCACRAKASSAMER